MIMIGGVGYLPELNPEAWYAQASCEPACENHPCLSGWYQCFTHLDITTATVTIVAGICVVISMYLVCLYYVVSVYYAVCTVTSSKNFKDYQKTCFRFKYTP